METKDRRLLKFERYLEGMMNFLKGGLRVPGIRGGLSLVFTLNEDLTDLSTAPTILSWVMALSSGGGMQAVKDIVKPELLKLTRDPRTFAVVHHYIDEDTGDMILIVEMREGNQAWQLVGSTWRDDPQHLNGLHVFEQSSYH